MNKSSLLLPIDIIVYILFVKGEFFIMEKEFEALKAKFKEHEKFWNGFFYLLMILVTVEAVFTAISVISTFLFVLGKIFGLFLGILAIILAFRFISNRVKDKIDSKGKEDTIVIDEAKSNE